MLASLRLVLAGLALAVTLAACGVHFQSSDRSGTVKDDYVGEPLSDAVKKYEHALAVSNSAVDKLIAGDVHSLYAELCGEEFATHAREPDIVRVMEQVTREFGALKTYKRDQWGFAVRSDAGKAVLCSNKLVECEKGMARIIFLFADDGQYEKLLGFQVRAHHGVADPGQS